MNDLFDYMDRYFSGELTPGEKEVFEKRCTSDPAFAEELAMYIAIRDHVKQQMYINENQELAEVEQEDLSLSTNDFKSDQDTEISLEENAGEENFSRAAGEEEVDKQIPAGKGVQIIGQGGYKKRPTRLFIRLAVAAAIVSIVVLAITWNLNDDKNGTKDVVNNKGIDTAGKIKRLDTTPVDYAKEEAENKGKPPDTVLAKSIPDFLSVEKRNKLFKKNFRPDEAPTDVVKPLESFVDPYNNSDYEKSIAALDDIQENQVKGEPTDEEELSNFYTYYYKAQCYLALNNIGQAIKELETALDKSPDDSFKARVQWYMALAYLQRGDLKTTKNWLKQLSQNNQPGKYKKMSEKLSQQLPQE